MRPKEHRKGAPARSAAPQRKPKLPPGPRPAIVNFTPDAVAPVLQAVGGEYLELRRGAAAPEAGATIIMYATKPVGKVVGTARVKEIYKASSPEELKEELRRNGFNVDEEAWNEGYGPYLEGASHSSLMVLDEIRRFDEPRDLPAKPGQGMRYVDPDKEGHEALVEMVVKAQASYRVHS